MFPALLQVSKISQLCSESVSYREELCCRNAYCIVGLVKSRILCYSIEVISYFVVQMQTRLKLIFGSMGQYSGTGKFFFWGTNTYLIYYTSLITPKPNMRHVCRTPNHMLKGCLGEGMWGSCIARLPKGHMSVGVRKNNPLISM